MGYSVGLAMGLKMMAVLKRHPVIWEGLNTLGQLLGVFCWASHCMKNDSYFKKAHINFGRLKYISVSCWLAFELNFMDVLKMPTVILEG